MANFTGQPISSSYQRVLQIDSNIIQDGLGNTVNATINSLTGSFSGSLTGIATSSSYALTASYVPAVPEDLGSSLGVNLATAAVLSNTPLYNNGTLGVGATLSASVAGALVVDGITSGIGDRILVKNQTSQLQNGVYEVTVAGATGVRYILTRTTDADETEEFDPQIVIPSQGNTNKGKIFGQTTNLPTIGTSPIVYTEISSNQFVSQVTTGTQNLYNIPWWTASTRQLSRGINRFQFDSVNNRLRITGSLTVSGSITGSAGVVNSLTASYSVTSSYTLNAESASYVSTASYVENAQTASYVLNAVSASYAPDITFPYTGSAQITGSLGITGSLDIGSIFNVNSNAGIEITSGRTIIPSGNRTLNLGSGTRHWQNVYTQFIRLADNSGDDQIRISAPVLSSTPDPAWELILPAGSGSVGQVLAVSSSIAGEVSTVWTSSINYF